jgi:hypothetical protein
MRGVADRHKIVGHRLKGRKDRLLAEFIVEQTVGSGAIAGHHPRGAAASGGDPPDRRRMILFQACLGRHAEFGRASCRSRRRRGQPGRGWRYWWELADHEHIALGAIERSRSKNVASTFEPTRRPPEFWTSTLSKQTFIGGTRRDRHGAGACRSPVRRCRPRPCRWR